MSNQTQDINEQVVELYEDYLWGLDEEFLGYEYADVIGNEDSYFEWLLFHRGVQGVIEFLVNNYADNLIENPEYRRDFQYAKTMEAR